MVAERSEWLSKRAETIGASEVAAVLGLSPWMSPYALWAQKTGLAPVDDEETEWQRWGNILEPAICEEYTVQTGRKIIDHGRHAYRRSETCPVLGATLDREIVAFDDRGPGCLEVKNVTAYKLDDWLDTPPLIYQVQVQAQLEVTGWKWGSIAALIGGNTFKWIDVERDDRFIEVMRKKCHEFWQLVESRTPPPVDGSDATAEALKALYPKENGETVALPGDALFWDNEIKEANAAIKEAEAKKQEAQNKIKAAMGDAAYGVLPDGGRYSLITSVRKGYVTKDTSYRSLRRLSK